MLSSASRLGPSKNKGQALGGLSLSSSEASFSSVVVPAVHCQTPRQNLSKPYIVGKVGLVLGAAQCTTMGEQVNISVSWEEVEATNGLHPHGELWIRVLSEKAMEPTIVLPEEIVNQIPSELLKEYNHRTACDWQADLREDDDETVIEWPHEQWWALPKRGAA